MSEFLGFTCPKCGGHEISCVQTNIVVTQKIRVPADEDGVKYEWYDEPDIDDTCSEIVEYRCANPRCGYELPIDGYDDWDREELREYLKALPENQEEQNEA